MLLQTSMKVGIRFVSYESLKPILSPLVAGLVAGALEAFVWIQPTERLKVLRIHNGHEHRTILKSVAILFHTQGISGLWRGGSATVTRNSLTVGVRFWLVEQMMPFIRSMRGERSTAENAGIAGFIAGSITTVLNQPIDVIKTRMNADQVGADKPKFSSNIDCARSIWNEGGIKAYSSGLSARIFKISIGQGVIFSVYSKVQLILFDT
jgi:Mitochondrial carrier protein